jgi:hypothetical protein
VLPDEVAATAAGAAMARTTRPAAARLMILFLFPLAVRERM